MTSHRFRIIKKLGESGFGVVYEARDEPLKRTVALKVLKSSLTADIEVYTCLERARSS